MQGRRGRSTSRRGGWLLAALAFAPLPVFAGGCDLPPVARVLALDAASRTTNAYEAQRTLRQFVLFWYRDVAGDVIAGYGPWFDTLADSFGPACADRSALAAWLRQLLRESPSATDFSRRVAVARAAAW